MHLQEARHSVSFAALAALLGQTTRAETASKPRCLIEAPLAFWRANGLSLAAIAVHHLHVRAPLAPSYCRYNHTLRDRSARRLQRRFAVLILDPGR